MEVRILKDINATDLEMQIASYLSTGWRMDGNVVVTMVGGDYLLYVQKMVRGE